MASRISGFGDIHQGGGDGGVRRTEAGIIPLCFQQFDVSITIGREAIPDCYIGQDSLISKGHRRLFMVGCHFSISQNNVREARPVGAQ
jgi:hypothetical protein